MVIPAQASGIRFYCGINETAWNHHPVAPGGYACISPVYGKTERTHQENAVSVPTDTQIIQDSGAFSDSMKKRLSYPDALKRQISHAAKYHYARQIEAVASYDLLIDEKWNEQGQRHKSRWSESEASAAVDTTIQAAHYLCQYRFALPFEPSLILSAQGVTPTQYLRCAQNAIRYANLDQDILGLGGWCIIGKMSRFMLPVFHKTISLVIPWAETEGIKRIHIWGVLYAPAIGALLYLCDQHGIQLSTDSAGPSVRPCLGTWGYMGWSDRNYSRPPVEIRGLERARHVQATRDWLSRLHETKFYKYPELDKQSRLL